MSILQRFWRDEDGFVLSTELVLVATLLVMSMVVGLQSIRDSALAELADVAAAIGLLNQSYSVAGVAGHASSVAGSVSFDFADFCDTWNLYQNQGLNQFSQCVTLLPAVAEGYGAGAGAAPGAIRARVIEPGRP